MNLARRIEIRSNRIAGIEFASAAVTVTAYFTRSHSSNYLLRRGKCPEFGIDAMIAMRINHSVWHCKWHTVQAHVVEAKQKNNATRFHLTIKSISISLTPEKLTSSRSMVRCPMAYTFHFNIVQPFGGWIFGTMKKKEVKTSQLSMWRETKQSRKMRWLLLYFCYCGRMCIGADIDQGLLLNFFLRYSEQFVIVF